MFVLDNHHFLIQFTESLNHNQSPATVLRPGPGMIHGTAAVWGNLHLSPFLHPSAVFANRHTAGVFSFAAAFAGLVLRFPPPFPSLWPVVGAASSALPPLRVRSRGRGLPLPSMGDAAALFPALARTAPSSFDLGEVSCGSSTLLAGWGAAAVGAVPWLYRQVEPYLQWPWRVRNTRHRGTPSRLGITRCCDCCGCRGCAGSAVVVVAAAALGAVRAVEAGGGLGFRML